MTTVHSDDSLARQVLAGVRFHEIGKLYHFDCSHVPGLRVGEYVIVETTRGRQLGQVMNLLETDADEVDRDYKPILDKATPRDLMNLKLWQSREAEALVTCREKAVETDGLDGVKFVTAQYNYDGSLLTFLFSAEDKVNTNRLRSTLQRSFKAKIEMRQIGPRDVAKVLGGMGACGIQRCCSTFLTEFSPISIKMAKAQGVSLNPSEITGMCGRLRCCLIYEYEQYAEARKHLPKRNKRVGTPHGEGRVTVMVEDSRHLVAREDIIPLEEWLALKAKAEAGCRSGETCSKPSAADENDEETFEPSDEPRASESPPEEKPELKHRRRRSRSRRNRRKRSHDQQDNDRQ
jgi:cell fate regulator YaaT (PSP1 superfamily)